MLHEMIITPLLDGLEAWGWRVIGLLGLGFLFALVGLGVMETAGATPRVSPTPIAYPAGLQAAWEAEDWDKVITLLTPMQQTQPPSRLLQGWLAQAHLQKALYLRHQGLITAAQIQLTHTLALVPDQPTAQTESRLAHNYLAGTTYYQQGEWLKAIHFLTPIWQEQRDYGHVTDLLYNAYYNQGLAEQGAAQQLQTDTSLATFIPVASWRLKRLQEARRMFELALILRPDLAAPRYQLAQVAFDSLADDDPLEVITVVPHKLIVVGLAEQRMWVYDHEELIYDFVVSTGEEGRETAIGDFSILNKIDVAYASTWNLDMPYWMGIYWAGSLQNGIHALPIVRDTGYKLWDGFLGQRVSYGCVILSDEDAATLYDWAEVGVKMKIVPSLWAWAEANDEF